MFPTPTIKKYDYSLTVPFAIALAGVWDTILKNNENFISADMDYQTGSLIATNSVS
jgi:hypothetical protein